MHEGDSASTAALITSGAESHFETDHIRFELGGIHLAVVFRSGVAGSICLLRRSGYPQAPGIVHSRSSRSVPPRGQN